MNTLKPVVRAALLIGVGAFAAGAGAAELVGIDWGQAQRFELHRALPAGQVLEVCGPLAAGQAVDWQFVASAPVAFNIHHHIGKQAIYAERRQKTKSMTARFQPKEASDYCWMWTAPKDQAVQLQLLLRH